MAYFFIYLLIIIVNIFAVLFVLKIRRNRLNDADVITDATLVEEDSIQQVRTKKSRSLFNKQDPSTNIFVEYEEIEEDVAEKVFDGQFLDIAVKEKIVKKKGNWYLYGEEKLGYGKDKAKFYLLENPDVASEIRSQLSIAIDIDNEINQSDLKKLKSDDSGNEIDVSSNEIENQRSLSFINQNLEVELSEVYVKSNILKKVLENAIGTEVMISVDVSERFNPLIAEPENFTEDIVTMLKEVDYLTSAVKNISKNAKYLGIDVTEEMLREKLTLMTSNRFSIVFTKKPVEKHRNIPRLIFDLPLKKNRRQREVTKASRSASTQNTGKRSLLPLGVGLLIVGFIILIYSVNQTFFSTSVINDEQNLLENKFQVSELNLSEIRNQNMMTEQSLDNLEQTDEFQESIISIATKTLTNQAAKAEFLPDVVGRLTILSANINHYVVFGATNKKLEYGPGYILGTSLPGTGGNFAIAGHRTTYGAPFGNLDRVQVGETIIFQTNTNQYKYKIIEVKIVSPEDNYVLENYGDDRITLTTCHPKFSAKQRLIVIGQLEKVEVFG
jgi:LPXTG-site transpeptidase (sortase) family protein|tara:strand:- start:1744 stop:3408 length:1665 start_codon:yes stop_codon:yes gene_type:complete